MWWSEGRVQKKKREKKSSILASRDAMSAAVVPLSRLSPLTSGPRVQSLKHVYVTHGSQGYSFDLLNHVAIICLYCEI